MTSRQFCLSLNLKDDEELIALYEHYHRPSGVWPEVLECIRESGIINMNIYRSDVQLIMVMDVDESFSFERKANLDKNNLKVQKWEKLMDKFQEVDSSQRNNKGKWKMMKMVFKLPKD